MNNYLCTFLVFFLLTQISNSASLFLEAESFTEKGGWVVDQQFMDQMGSPYLMAHGMGVPVEDASVTVSFPASATYTLYVRTYNWTSPWSDQSGAGGFEVKLGEESSSVLGIQGSQWEWQKAGDFYIENKEIVISLHDLTGFNGRCDALYFTTDSKDIPPAEKEDLNYFRKEHMKTKVSSRAGEKYDLVVVGGGIAGICASVSAARLGLKVALIHDRAVLGGCNSSEVRVHLGGRINKAPYPELGNLIKEFGPIKEGNARPAENYEDEKKMRFVLQEKNIALFSSYRAIDVKKKKNKIISVVAKHIETGDELIFKAPLFADCTGDACIGFLAGADYRMGREGKDEYGEEEAPIKADSMTMGASVQWYSVETDEKKDFPLFSYGLLFNPSNVENVTMGEWTWETGMNKNQIDDFEQIRDYGFMVIYSNWSCLKNECHAFPNRKLGWVAYVAGKRESRRLIGDYILKEQDIKDQKVYEDATASTTWSIDLHYPDPKNTLHFPNKEFKSIAQHTNIHSYPIPYRCLYSRNISNLFMAGRNISVTHVALGTTRVMRTTGMMGEVVGMAAAVCKKQKALPKEVYQKYLDQLRELMIEGIGKKDLPNNQQYNEGGTLDR